MPAQQAHDDKRHGTTTLFAALMIATGKVTDRCYDRHTHAEFLDFLKLVARPTRGCRCTWSAATTPPTSAPPHKHPEVKAWLAKHPRVQLHVTPTSGSWLNMVEIFFGIITRQAIRRGTFTSVKELITAIETFIDGWNSRCEPFVWTKTADEIIGEVNRKRTNATRH